MSDVAARKPEDAAASSWSAAFPVPLLANLCLCLPLLAGAFSGRLTATLLPLLVVTAALLCLIAGRRQGDTGALFSAVWQRPRLATWWPWFALFALALLSIAWSDHPGPAASRSLQIGVMLGFAVAGFALARGLAASDAGAKTAGKLLPFLLPALLVLLALLAVEIATQGAILAAVAPSSGGFAYYGRNATVLLLLLPALSGLALNVGLPRWQRRLLWICVLLLGAATTQMASGTVAVALITATATAGMGLLRPRLAGRIIAVAVVLGILGTPLIARYSERVLFDLHGTRNYSLAHRSEIWAFAVGRYFERPLLGWGIEGSRRLPGGSTMYSEVVPWGQLLPLHPHNMPLQVWVELGPLGAVLLAIATARIALAASRIADPAAAAGRLFVLVGALTVGASGYGAWQAWWLGLLPLAAMATVVFLPPRPTIDASGRAP